jgi:hypothetical protein
LLAGEGVEGPNSDNWTESLALCLLARNSGAMYTIIPLRFEINVDANTSRLRNVLRLFIVVALYPVSYSNIFLVKKKTLKIPCWAALRPIN